jgi:hypothetical protein
VHAHPPCERRAPVAQDRVGAETRCRRSAIGEADVAQLV